MHNILFFILLFSVKLSAQSVIHIDTVTSKKDFESLRLAYLYSDSNATCDVVWIKTKVEPHKHLHHTEFAYVLEGTGQMLLSDSIFEVRAGDLITIKYGTVHASKATSNLPVKILTITLLFMTEQIKLKSLKKGNQIFFTPKT